MIIYNTYEHVLVFSIYYIQCIYYTHKTHTHTHKVSILLGSEEALYNQTHYIFLKQHTLVFIFSEINKVKKKEESHVISDQILP